MSFIGHINHLRVFTLKMVALNDLMQMFLDQEALDGVSTGQNRTLKRGILKLSCGLNSRSYLRAVSVVEHSENDPGHGILARVVMRRRQQSRQIVLQRLAQNTVKSQIRSRNVLLGPVVLSQLANLGPQTVQVLFLRVRSVRVPNLESVVMIFVSLHQEHFN